MATGLLFHFCQNEIVFVFFWRVLSPVSALQVWSCGKLQNMELGLFAGRCLVAVLHQHDSTSLWPRTSSVVDGKPLFLKELRRLWAKLDAAAAPLKSGHGAHDTVLLDNHAEKFERNPLHCCLEVPLLFSPT